MKLIVVQHFVSVIRNILIQICLLHQELQQPVFHRRKVILVKQAIKKVESGAAFKH